MLPEGPTVEILATTILEMLVERTERVPRVSDRGVSGDRTKKRCLPSFSLALSEKESVGEHDFERNSNS